MKHPLEILIKLKLMFTSYAELFNASIKEKVMRSFRSPQSKKSAQTFPHKFMQCYAERYFFISLPYPHNSASQIYAESRSPMRIRIFRLVNY